MQTSLTVGQLRAIIQDLPEHLPVYASAGLHRVGQWPDKNLEYYIDRARHSKACGIANEHVSLELGRGFDW